MMYQISSTVRWATAMDVFPGGEFKVGHAAAFEFEEYADVGSVGCGDVGFRGQVFGAEFGHGVLLWIPFCLPGEWD